MNEPAVVTTEPNEPTGFEPSDTNDATWWQFDDADEISTVVYRDSESPDQRAARRDLYGRGYLCTIQGPISPEIVRQRCGGGKYRLLISRSGKLLTTKRIEIIGVPRDLDAPIDAPPPAPVVTPTATGSPALDAATLAAVVAAAVKAAFAEAAPPMRESRDASDSFDMALKLVDRMSAARSGPSVDANELVKGHMDMLQRGIAIAKREGGEGRSIGDALVESMPALVEVLDKVFTHRAVTAAMPGAAAPAPSAQANAAVESLRTLASMVARALSNGVEAGAFAATLEDLLTPLELMQIKALEPARVVTLLGQFARMFPELASPALPVFVEHLHAALNEPAEAENSADGDQADGDPQ